MGKKSRSKRRTGGRNVPDDVRRGATTQNVSSQRTERERDRAVSKRLASSPSSSEADNHGDAVGQTVADVIERQRQRFVENFGREPRSNDPVFFDQEAASPSPLDEATLRAQLARPGMAEELRVEPAFLAAMLEVGYAVTDQTRHLFSAEDLRAFDDALVRHRSNPDG